MSLLSIRIIFVLLVSLSFLVVQEIFSSKISEDPLSRLQTKIPYDTVGQVNIKARILKETSLYGLLYLNSYELILEELSKSGSILYQLGDVIDNPIQIRFNLSEETFEIYRKMYYENFLKSIEDFKQEKEKEKKNQAEINKLMKKDEIHAVYLLNLLIKDFMVSMFQKIYDQGEQQENETKLEKAIKEAIYSKEGMRNQLIKRYDLDEESDLIRSLFLDQINSYTYFYNVDQDWINKFCGFQVSANKTYYKVNFYIVSHLKFFEKSKAQADYSYEDRIAYCLGLR